MDKIWLASYPPGVPTEIDPDQYGSLVQLLEESFVKYADRNAFACMDKSIMPSSSRALLPPDCCFRAADEEPP